MKIENINVNDTISEAKNLLKKEAGLSPALKAVFEIVLLLMKVMIDRLTLNSSNSSKPPSQDPNRQKKKKKKNGKGKKRKVGGQKGHKGKTLGKVDDPREN